MQEQVQGSIDVSLESSQLWKRFNLIVWPLVLVGILGVFSGSLATGFSENTVGGILFTLLSWTGVMVSMFGLPAALGYFSYKIGGSWWYLLVGILGLGGMVNWPTFLIGYFIVLTLHKKKSNRKFLLMILIALAILIDWFSY